MSMSGRGMRTTFWVGRSPPTAAWSWRLELGGSQPTAPAPPSRASALPPTRGRPGHEPAPCLDLVDVSGGCRNADQGAREFEESGRLLWLAAPCRAAARLLVRLGVPRLAVCPGGGWALRCGLRSGAGCAPGSL